jgi:uncharacterized caspase-like protein
VAALLAIGSLHAHAQGRVALVIGNSAYDNKTVLPNSINDARDIAAALRRLSFAVTEIENGDLNAMRRAIQSFSQQARGAGMAAVFYAGLGMQIGGENWLIPIDAQLKADTAVDQQAVDLNTLIEAASAATEFGLVMFDASRNNPFAGTAPRATGTRPLNGVARHTEPSNSLLVAYATAPGATTADGDGRNSPFTAALLRHIETPDLEVSRLFSNVRADVAAATQRKQLPFVFSSLSGAVYLKPADAPGTRPNGGAASPAPTPPH